MLCYGEKGIVSGQTLKGTSSLALELAWRVKIVQRFPPSHHYIQEKKNLYI